MKSFCLIRLPTIQGEVLYTSNNVFIERLWRTIKYEEVYLKAYESVSQARASLGRYLKFYNTGRPHSRLDRQIPDQVYFNQLPLPRAA